MKDENHPTNAVKDELPPTGFYQKPSVRELDEKEVLSAFQVTVAAITWWVM